PRLRRSRWGPSRAGSGGRRRSRSRWATRGSAAAPSSWALGSPPLGEALRGVRHGLGAVEVVRRVAFLVLVPAAAAEEASADDPVRVSLGCCLEADVFERRVGRGVLDDPEARQAAIARILQKIPGVGEGAPEVFTGRRLGCVRAADDLAEGCFELSDAALGGLHCVAPCQVGRGIPVGGSALRSFCLARSWRARSWRGALRRLGRVRTRLTSIRLGVFFRKWSMTNMVSHHAEFVGRGGTAAQVFREGAGRRTQRARRGSYIRVEHTSRPGWTG